MILHINTSKEWRGGENQTLYLVKGLDSLNVKQTIILQPNSPLQEKISTLKLTNSKVYPLSMKSEWDWKAVKEIRKIIQEENISLVHTHTGNAHSLAFFAKKKNDPWKLIVSRRVDFKIRKNFFSRWKYYSPLVDLYVCVSKYIHKLLIQEGVDPRKVITIQSGVDFSRFEKLTNRETAKKQLGISKKTIVLGIIAALVDHKDYPTLLKAISLLPNHLDIKLLILGEGELKDSLIALSNQLQIQDKVQFLGFQPNIELYLSAFDIFCFSSKEEGLGTSVLDAMACGLPVIATQAGGIPEMVEDGKGGYLVPIQSPEEFSEKILILLQNESLRKSMGEFNKKKVQEFSITQTIQKTYQVYYSFLGNSLSPSAPSWEPSSSKTSITNKQYKKSKSQLQKKTIETTNPKETKNLKPKYGKKN